MIKILGIKLIRGVLLHGLPGTGKTLLGRKIAETLGRKAKFVSCPDLFDQGSESEKMVRELFVNAGKEQKSHGDHSDLYVLILEEFDAIARRRGTSLMEQNGSCIVNQLLEKMFSTEWLNNVLFIGITSRVDLINEDLLKPGHFEIQVEMKLPHELGRLEILQVHTSKLSQFGFLGPDISLPEIAAQTKNFSGAELEGVVRRAISFAAGWTYLGGQISPCGHRNTSRKQVLKVARNDFLDAIRDITPIWSLHVKP